MNPELLPDFSLPGEDEIFKEMTQLTIDMMEESENGCPLRVQHAKANACVTATFEIAADIPDDLQHGVFSQPGKIFEAVVIMEAKREVILDIVLDYARYPDFMPNVSRVEILQQDESTAVLNYTLSLPLGKVKKYRVRMKASEPDDQTSLIQWQLEQWLGLQQKDTIRDTTGFWRIEELDAKRSLVLYHVYTDPGKVPFGLGWIVDLLGKDSVPKVLLQTKVLAEKGIGHDG